MKKGVCKNGHIFNETNTYVRSNGTRSCRECSRINNKKRWQDPVYRQKESERAKKIYAENRKEMNEKNKQRWAMNKEKYNQQQRDSFPEKLRKLKTEVLTHYGNGKLMCVCCGENIITFLTLDHINGRDADDRGWNKRKRVGRVLWSFVKRQGFPEGYQTLCWNCNSGRQINNGICPHQKQEQKIAITQEWQSNY